MDGSWKVFEAGRRWTGGPAHQIRVILGTADRTAVGYRLPVLELLRTTDEDRVVGHLGPDLLGPDWDPELALANLLADGSRPLGTPCSTSATSPASATCTRASCASCSASLPGSRSATCRRNGRRRCPPWPNGSWRPTATGRTATPRAAVPRAVRVRPRAPALSALRHVGPGRRPGRRLPRPPHVLVPELPAGSGPAPAPRDEEPAAPPRDGRRARRRRAETAGTDRPTGSPPPRAHPHPLRLREARKALGAHSAQSARLSPPTPPPRHACRHRPVSRAPSPAPSAHSAPAACSAPAPAATAPSTAPAPGASASRSTAHHHSTADRARPPAHYPPGSTGLSRSRPGTSSGASRGPP